MTEPADSLYSQEVNEQAPWWQKNLLNLNQPVLFGTWDGVFTTVMVNIFGIIVFLRMGWIVGTAGVADSILLLIICTSLALITVFSAIGIVDRTHIKSGGIYFLISHVLGGRLGGAVGVMYALGQAVATGLVSVGFAESVAHLFDSESKLLTKGIAILTLALLTALNTAGVSWVIRLQLVLLAFIGLAVFDFGLGSLFTSDEEHGVYSISSSRLRLNAHPHYEAVNCSSVGVKHTIPEQSFFKVFGVFFANFLGVLAGVNMSGDLKEPHKSIPLGELSAVGVSSSVCFIFILILGSTVDRTMLLCDNLIEEKISLTGIFFMVGLYVCSLSSTIGSLLGTPRVLQGIAAEGIIPIMNPLAQGRGPNNNPVLAGMVLMGVASVFVLLGDLNELAILSTMPFMITYAFVNYAYVSLAMSYDLATVNLAANPGQSYGSTQGEGELNELFPERKEQCIETGTIIDSQPATWYAMFSNRYISFIGFIVNLLIIILIDWRYAAAHFAALGALWYYIGHVCPTCSPGISTFSFAHMFRTAFSSLEAVGNFGGNGPAIIPQAGPSTDMTIGQLNNPNYDYDQRKPYHHAENLTQELE